MKTHLKIYQNLSYLTGLAGIGLVLLVAIRVWKPDSTLLTSGLLLISLSVIFLSLFLYYGVPAGIKNHRVFQTGLSARGWSAWTLSLVLSGFYVLLYWYPEWLGLRDQNNEGLVALFDPLSYFLKNQKASQWFVYGVLYTLAILLFGIKFIWKYRHSRYQVIRTISVMFFQTAFAFLLPEWMLRLNMPFNDFKNMWPLNYYFFDGWHLDELLHSGSIGYFILIWGLLMIFLISPVLTYFFGKRWYCSWVCGCGGLAETAGDAFRQLSDKSKLAWKIERWSIYSILFITVLMTIGVLYSYVYHSPSLLGIDTSALRSWYGFLIGAAFSGVIGVGFYPLLGSRVWCRFGCPMAAILGIQQKYFSRFRITTNGSQCISCGNCSTYCEMGIDVRAYAQQGKDILRASCVGCGICSVVCPRGVLKLENGTRM